MPKKKLLIFVTGVFLILLLLGSILGILLRILNEIRYSLEYFLPYWLVSPLLFLASVLFLLVIYQYGWPMYKSFLKKKYIK